MTGATLREKNERKRKLVDSIFSNGTYQFKKVSILCKYGIAQALVNKFEYIFYTPWLCDKKV